MGSARYLPAGKARRGRRDDSSTEAFQARRYVLPPPLTLRGDVVDVLVDALAVRHILQHDLHARQHAVTFLP